MAHYRQAGYEGLVVRLPRRDDVTVPMTEQLIVDSQVNSGHVPGATRPAHGVIFKLRTGHHANWRDLIKPKKLEVEKGDTHRHIWKVCC